MRIKVIKADKFVEFSSSIGTGLGQCSHQNLQEEVVCHIEIDINFTLTLGKNTKKNLDSNLYLKHEGDINWINGIVESIDDDGQICLRLAQDCIIMVYGESNIRVGDFLLITINKENLKIWVYDFHS